MSKLTRLQHKCFLFVLLCFTLCFIIIQLPFFDRSEAEQDTTETFDFTLKTIDGEVVSLNDYRGKKVVHLVFWATWCPHCLMEMPKVKTLHKALDNKPYEVLAVDVGINESIKRIKKIQKQYEIPCKILLDEQGTATKLFKIIGVPCHIIVDKDGTIIDRVNELPKDPLPYMQKFLSQKEKTVPKE